MTHRKTCGIREEEREKFSCEICGKEYNSVPGLTYHMKTKHVEVLENLHSRSYRIHAAIMIKFRYNANSDLVSLFQAPG